MTHLVTLEIVLMTTILWIGFVCAISFMEAWLKFKAPGVTLQIGLGIGQLVFSALNKVELLLGSIIAIIGLLKENSWIGFNDPFFTFPMIILLIQTFWFLPILKHRIISHLNNNPLPKSKIHVIYIITEFVKVVLLIISAIKILVYFSMNQ